MFALSPSKSFKDPSEALELSSVTECSEVSKEGIIKLSYSYRNNTFLLAVLFFFINSTLLVSRVGCVRIPFCLFLGDLRT